MRSGLIILIVLVIIVLIAILMTSPTCRSAVTGVFKGKPKVDAKKSMPPVSAPTPMIEQVAKPIVMNNKSVQQAPPVAQQAERVASPVASNGPIHGSGQVNTNRSAPAQEQVSTQQASAPRVNASAKLLTGNLFELLDPSVDVQAEFGISEAELDVLAKKYKEQHLDTPKPEVIRSRHLTRTGLENAERVSRQSFITAAGTGKRNDGEEVFTSLFRDHLLPVSGASKLKARGTKKR